MDKGCIAMLIITLVAWWLLSRLTAPVTARPVIKESIDGATLERCWNCRGVVGAALKESITWRVSHKDRCPHCGKKIKR
jgi:hypothetical protein